MLQRIKLFFQNNRNIIRIVRYALISIVLLVITWILDYRFPAVKEDLPDIILLSPEVTVSFLSILSGTFLTVSTFTLATILTVLNTYQDAFTPRIVQDFIDKPNVLSLFGVFIGGFFYTVLSLFLVQNIADDAPLISGTIAVFYAIAAMLSFVLFAFKVLTDIKASSVVENVYHNALVLIEDLCRNRKDAKRYQGGKAYKTLSVYAKESGYFYDIDQDTILRTMGDIESELFIEEKIGEFVLQDMIIGTIRIWENLDYSEEDYEDLADKVSSGIIINKTKNDTRDYHYEITCLVEIAIKALSPGINDPNTAILCIQKIGILLGKLFSTENNYVILAEDDKVKLVYNGYTPMEEMYLTFKQILFYGREDMLVSQAILKSLFMIYLASCDRVYDDIREFFDYCYKTCMENCQSEMDKERIQSIYHSFYKGKEKTLAN
jgi:uncharacterized membrane protein